MITKSNLKNYLSSFYLVIIAIGLFSSCASKPSVFNRNGWSIEIDKKQEILTVNHEDLGLIIKDIRLGFVENNVFSSLSEWSVKSENDELIITTSKPEVITWEFVII